MRYAAAPLRGAHALPPWALRPGGGGGLEEFLRLWSAGDVERLMGNTFPVTDLMKPVVVPVYPV